MADSLQHGMNDDGKIPAPWERRHEIGFIEACMQTFSGVLFSPGKFFSSMKQGGGFQEPFLFTLLVIVPISIVTGILYSLAFNALIDISGIAEAIASHFLDGRASDAFMRGFSGGLNQNLAFNIIMQVFFIPIGVISWSFIYPMLYYVGFAINGEKRKNFQTLYRTSTYALATVVLSIVPLLGQMVYGIWYIVAVIIGMAKTTPTSYGKSAFAALWYLAVVILLLFAFVAVILLIVGAVAVNH